MALLTNDLTRYACSIEVRFETVRLPFLSANEPPAMTTVGSSRNSPTYKKNGTTPSHVRGSRRPPRSGRAAVLIAGLPAAVKC